MTITIISLVLSILAIILTSITAIFSVLAYSNVVGLKNSTHQIQYMPVDPNEPELTDGELNKQMRKAYGYTDEENDYIASEI